MKRVSPYSRILSIYSLWLTQSTTSIEVATEQCGAGDSAVQHCSGDTGVDLSKAKESNLLSSLSARTAAICCFTPEDVQYHRIGRQEVGVLVVDNFLCSERLPDLEATAKSLFHSMRHQGGSFPGVYCDLRDRSKCAKTIRMSDLAAKLVDVRAHRLSEAYLQCVDSALQLLDIRGQLLDLWPLFVAIGQTFGLNRVGADSRGLDESANQEESFGEEWWRHDWSHDWSLGLQTVTYPGSGNFIHIDNGMFVSNLHLSNRYNDSGISFWRLRGDASLDHDTMEVCSSRMQCRRMAIAVGAHQDSLYKGEGTHSSETWWPTEDDPTEMFEKYDLIPMRWNRLVLYHGHAPHVGHFPAAAVERLSKGEPRFMLQSFMRVEHLIRQFDPDVWVPE